MKPEWIPGLMMLVIHHSCKKNGYAWPLFRFQTQAPEKCFHKEEPEKT
jgi:hypothetical protein